MKRPGCQKCGHPKEGAVQPHNLGCVDSRTARIKAGIPGADDAMVARIEATLDRPTCAKDGCIKEPAKSRGPRPAKYCEDHKTVRRSK